MRRFSLFRRGRIWYVRLHNPKTKRYTSARSTGEVQKNGALLVVAEWMRDGIPDAKRQGIRPVGDVLELDAIITAVRSMPLQPVDAGRIVDALKARGLIETAVVKAGPGAEALVTFLERFWSYDESPYIREKLAHEHRLGRRHAYDMLLHVRTHWKPYFTDRRLVEITRADLQDFSLWLKERKGLKGKTVNNILAAGTVGLRWARGDALIPANPAEGLMQFSGKAIRRGVLAEEEVGRLFARPWQDERAWLGNAIALSTGLRQGEVLAVQVRDIADDRVHVRHAWSNLDGLKAPKTGEERTVPLMPGLRAALLDLARKNPHGVGPASFVFWSVKRADRPMDAHGLLDPLKAALLRLTLIDDDAKDPEKIRQAETYWRSRRVCFHSWRHLYAARMADRLEARKVMSATGHKSGAVFEVYADHASEKVFQEVSAAAADTFGKLVTFPGTGASA